MNKILLGDSLEVLKTLPSESVDCVVTSPPYWNLRDYGEQGQLGLEPNYQDYISKLCDIFDEVRRVLKNSGTCWVNLGDSYAGSGKGPERGIDKGLEFRHLGEKVRPFVSSEAQAKSLVQIPARFSVEMADRGWILRNEIIWHKPNCMPASVKDRFTVDFEKVFFFVKNQKYYFEQQKEAATYTDSRANKGRIEYKNRLTKCAVVVGEDRNKRAVWRVATKAYRDAHFATYPAELIVPMIIAGCPVGGIVLDPFMGSGTTAVVARDLCRDYLGIEINPEYIKLAEKRLSQGVLI